MSLRDTNHLECPRCGWAGASHSLAMPALPICPECGAALSAGSAVIDVTAVPVGAHEDDSDVDYDADPFFDPALQDRPPEYGSRTQSIHFERVYSGNGGCGCCFGGCLAALLIAYLLFRGAMSVFFGS